MTIVPGTPSNLTLLMEPFGYSERALDLYRDLGPVVTLEESDEASRAAATILVVRLGHMIDEELLARFPRLRYVVSPTTGLNHIDLAACEARNVRVVSLKGEGEFLRSITATAEHTLGLLLALLRHIPQAHEAVVRRGEWDRDRFQAIQIASLTVGIVGLGRIGRQMWQYLSCLGARVVVCERMGEREDVDSDGPQRCGSLAELFAVSDAVTLHVHYCTENVHLVDRDVLRGAKKGLLLVNTSRGEILDEGAVVEALEDGRLGGAAVDVLEGEQFGEHLQRSLLLEYARRNNKVIITPHIGGCTRDAMAATEEFVARRLAGLVREV